MLNSLLYYYLIHFIAFLEMNEFQKTEPINRVLRIYLNVWQTYLVLWESPELFQIPVAANIALIREVYLEKNVGWLA